MKKVAAGEGLLGLSSRGEELSSWTGQQRGGAEQLDCPAEGRS